MIEGCKMATTENEGERKKVQKTAMLYFSGEINNKMQPCNRIYYSTVY
jgi:hypothetical protein